MSTLTQATRYHKGYVGFMLFCILLCMFCFVAGTFHYVLRCFTLFYVVFMLLFGCFYYVVFTGLFLPWLGVARASNPSVPCGLRFSSCLI